MGPLSPLSHLSRLQHHRGCEQEPRERYYGKERVGRAYPTVLAGAWPGGAGDEVERVPGVAMLGSPGR